MVENVRVSLYDETCDTYLAGEVSVDLSAHGFYRDATRGKKLGGAKGLIVKMLSNPDTWDLLAEVTQAKAETRNYERIETYRIGKDGMFFEVDREEGVVLSGQLQVRKYRNQSTFSGYLKVITYLGKKEVQTKSTYHPKTLGLWQKENEMFVACNNFGHLTAIEF